MSGKSSVKEKYRDDLHTLQDLVRVCGNVYGNLITAVVSEDQNGLRRNGYWDLYCDVASAAAFWTEKVGHHKNVALIGSFSYEWVVMFLGITCSGNIAVPLDPRDNELVDKLLEALPEGYYCDSSVIERATIQSMSRGRTVVVPGGNLGVPTSSILTGTTDRFTVDVLPEDPAVIVFTSGTTGFCKGVVLTHRNIIANVKTCLDYCGDSITAEECVVPVLPVTHMLQLTVGVVTPLAYGATICIGGGMKYISRDMKRFSPRVMVLVPLVVENLYEKIMTRIRRTRAKEFSEALEKSRALRAQGIDARRAIFKDILDQFGGKLETVFCGGARLDPDVVRGFDDIGISVYEGYGITECSPLIVTNGPASWKIGSVGPVPDTDLCRVRIIDREICVSGEVVFKEYLNNIEATKQAKEGGWFHTGDFGDVDDEGYLRVTGRKKNLIITADGNNVCPEELERYFTGAPYIKSIFVGEDREKKNCITLYVYPNYEDWQGSVAEMNNQIRTLVRTVNLGLPAFKRINNIEFYTTDFEKNALGKIRRFKYLGGTGND